MNENDKPDFETSDNNHLCAVRLDGSVCVNNSSLSHSRFVVSVYKSPDCSSHEAKDEFHCLSSLLLLSWHLPELMVVSGDFKAKSVQLVSTKRHNGDRFAVSDECIDSGDRLVQVCSGHRLFVAYTKFCRRKRH